jgi:hypothetical protein
MICVPPAHVQRTEQITPYICDPRKLSVIYDSLKACLRIAELARARLVTIAVDAELSTHGESELAKRRRAAAHEQLGQVSAVC